MGRKVKAHYDKMSASIGKGGIYYGYNKDRFFLKGT